MISFSGISSGIDTQAIVDQLIAVERAPITTLNQRKTAANTRLSTLGHLITRLKALKTNAQGLDTPVEVQALSAKSGNTDRVGVTASSLATAASFDVLVNNLATAHTSQSKGFVSNTAGIAGDGSVQITIGAGAPVTVNYTSADNLDAIASRINTNVTGVIARVLHDGTDYHLTISGKETGSAKQIAFVEGGTTLDLIERTAAVDASITLNGVTITRSTNEFSDVVAGVTFTAVAKTPVGESATKVDVTADLEGQKAKLKALIEDYNGAAEIVNSQVTYNGTKKGENSFFGDSTFRSLQGRLSAAITRQFSHGAGNVSPVQLGIKFDTGGKLKLDEKVFDAIAKSDPTAVTAVFTGANGLAAGLVALVDEFTRVGSTQYNPDPSKQTGHLVSKQQSINGSIRGFDDQIVRVERRATSIGESLQRQFLALEQITSRMQAQSNYLRSL